MSCPLSRVVIACFMLITVGGVAAQKGGSIDDRPPLGGGPGVPEEATRNSPMLAFLPNAAGLGAPDWVKPGVRITFYGMSASVPEGSYELQEDEKGPWEDPTTGKRYSKQEVAGSGGAGYLQIDVYAVDRSTVVLNGNVYGIAQPGSPPTLNKVLTNGFLAAAAAPADYWVHPKLLKAATEVKRGGLMVLRGSYPLGDRMVPSLNIVSRTAESYSSQAYDLESGLLVSSTTVGRGSLATLRLPGEAPQRGNSTSNSLKLVSVRQVNVPGFGAKNPEWVQRVRRMQYAGTVRWRHPFDAASQQMEGPASMNVRFGQRGDSWAMYDATFEFAIGGMPQQSVTQGMGSPAGGFYIDPGSFANVRSGQVLDEDPVTKIVTRVGELVPGRRITILTDGPGVQGESVYDLANGALVAITVVQPTSGLTFSLQLQGSE